MESRERGGLRVFARRLADQDCRETQSASAVRGSLTTRPASYYLGLLRGWRSQTRFVAPILRASAIASRTRPNGSCRSVPSPIRLKVACAVVASSGKFGWQEMLGGAVSAVEILWEPSGIAEVCEPGATHTSG